MDEALAVQPAAHCGTEATVLAPSVTARVFSALEHGSLAKKELLAGSEHDARPTHADVTIEAEVAALHEPAEKGVASEGRPYEANTTDEKTQPAGAVSERVPPSLALPETEAQGCVVVLPATTSANVPGPQPPQAPPACARAVPAAQA